MGFLLWLTDLLGKESLDRKNEWQVTTCPWTIPIVCKPYHVRWVTGSHPKHPGKARQSPTHFLPLEYRSSNFIWKTISIILITCNTFLPIICQWPIVCQWPWLWLSARKKYNIINHNYRPIHVPGPVSLTWL